MKIRTTILLLILTAGLTAYVLLHESRQPPRDLAGYLLFDLEGDPLRDGEVSVEIRPEHIAGIDIRGPSGEVILRKGEDGVWDIAKGLKDRANPEAVKTLLDFCLNAKILDTLSRREVESGAVKRQDLGLDDAGVIRLTYRRAGGVRLAQVKVGRTAPLGNAVYVWLDGLDERPDIYIVHPDLREVLTKPYDYFRDPGLLKYPPEQLTKVILRRGEGEIELSRTPPPGGEPQDAPWVISRPLLNARANQPAVNDFLGMLKAARIQGFSPVATSSAPSDSSTEKPLVELLLTGWPEDAKGSRLGFYPDTEADSGFALCRDRERRAEFKVEKDLVDQILLAESPETFRDPNLGNIDPSLVTTLEIAPRNGEAVQLYRFGERWVMRAPGEEALENAAGERVEQLIKNINKTEILEFTSDSLTDPAAFGLEPPLVTVTFGGGKHPALGRFLPLTPQNSRTLRLGVLPDGKVFANFAGEPFVYRVPPDVPGLIPLERVRWRSLQLPGFSLQQLRFIRQSVGGNPPVELKFDPLSFTWSATRAGEDVTDSLDKAAAERLGTLLGGLQAGSWRGANDAGASKALETAPILLEFRYESYGDAGKAPSLETMRLELAPMNASGPSPFYYGRLSGVEGIFTMDGKTVAALTRSPLLAAPAGG